MPAMEAAMVDTPGSTGKTKSSKAKPKSTEEDLQAIQADVASFAAQLGLATGGGFQSGFDDTDFRKTGSIAAKKDKKKAKEVSVSNSDKANVVDVKKAGKVGVDGEETGKQAGKAGKTKALQGKSSGKDKELSFGVAVGQTKKNVPNANGKGTKRALESEDGGQEDEKSFKKERRDVANPVNDVGQSASKKTGKGGDQGTGANKLEASKASSTWLSSKVSLQPATLWYEAAATASANLITKSLKAGDGKDVEMGSINENVVEEESVAKKRKVAEQLMEKAVVDYEKSRSKNSDTRWLMTARRSGTSADKVAAMTVMLQDHPMLNLRTLDALLGMVTSKGGKRHAAIGIDALKELFLTSLLPDRKLKYFTQHPLSGLKESKESAALLLYWYWEDCLKRRYERFIVALEEATKDNLLFLKEKALKTVFVLLKSKPEQERRLLSALVNKLGDPERKFASNASYLLSCLLTAHPNMKRVVVEEVHSFVFRQHVGTRARYYAVHSLLDQTKGPCFTFREAVFLNQIMLTNSGDGPMIAKQLINLYFALFRTVITGESKDEVTQKSKKKAKRRDKWKRKGAGKSDKEGGEVGVVAEVDIRLLSALLTGVNRAFPYVAADAVDAVIEEHTPVLFRLVHSSNFNVAVQALMLLHQLLLRNQAVSERFYRALYAVLLSPSLTKSSKAEMFLNLLFKALKEDIDSKRMAAFAKRLTQVALQQPPQFACGCLLLLSEVLKTRPSLWNGILHPEDQNEDEEHFFDAPDEDASDAGKSKQEEAPSRSVVREADVALLSAQDSQESDSDSGAGEYEKLAESLPDLGDEDDDNSSDEEDGKKRHQEQARMDHIVLTKTKTAAIDHQNKEPLSGATGTAKKTWPGKFSYDPRHRDPSYCNGDKACWWELSALANHMHPSVASMARTLLSGANVVYSGDPLRDLVLGAFLERFAEKKPKTRKHKEDGTFHGSALPVPNKMVASTRLGPAELLALDESEVPPEDVVFHKFYQTKAIKSKSQRKKKDTSGDKDEDITGIVDEDRDQEDGDDSDDEEVDALLEKDEGWAMGLSGVEGEDDMEDGQSEGEFDYDKFEDAFEVEDEEESDEALVDNTKKATKRKATVSERQGTDDDEWSESDLKFDIGNPPESASEDDDSMGSIDIGELPSDSDEEVEMSKKVSGKGGKIKGRKAIVTGGGKKNRTKERKESEIQGLPARQKGKSKSPFASLEDYAHITESGDAAKGIGKLETKT